MTRSRLLPFIAASPPLLLAALVAKLWFTGTLTYYVNDRTVWIVLFGGGLYALIGFVTIRESLTGQGNAQLGWRTLVFLLPLVLGLFVPARPLSVASGQASSLGALQLASHVSIGSSGDRFGYWVNALGDHPEPSWWAGQSVTLVGFVAHQVGLPRRSVIVGRYLVTCCVVDATLFGFPVQIERGSLPAEGSWVQVRGVFSNRMWADPSGSQYPLIQHAHLTAATVPASPYLSP